MACIVLSKLILYFESVLVALHHTQKGDERPVSPWTDSTLIGLMLLKREGLNWLSSSPRGLKVPGLKRLQEAMLSKQYKKWHYTINLNIALNFPMTNAKQWITSSIFRT